MVSSTNNNNETLIHDLKLASVGPGKVSGNNNIYEPNNIDLAMKLHYIKIIYFLDNEASEELTLKKIKESTFSWLNYYYESCGRFRRSDNGRPYIKCNDCGVRFLEAKSSKTMEEWLSIEDTCVQRLLLPKYHVLGPELTFSPLVFLQVTFFKCGGISLGLSWAHVLGDPFSASNYMNTLAQFLSGNQPNHPPYLKKSPPNNFEKPIKEVISSPLSIKNVGPIGDLWDKPTDSEIDTFSFHVAHTRLAQIQSKLSETDLTQTQIQPFEAVCAVIWQAIAKAKVGPRPNVITVLRKDATGPIEDEMGLRNTQIVSSVKADYSVEEAQLEDLAILIRDWAQDERAQIGEIVDRDPGGSDLIVYGSKLTFVDLQEANFYGFEIKGMCPKFVNCFVDGIGEEGVVLVLPSPKNEGIVVTLLTPNNYMAKLKEELKNVWDLIA
ncbi:hypothetical protein RND81_14G050100 [Saponaria officinalis]|uniref:Protein ECERIFERUM 26-like n=1 Tax=Saponaria officinalis TaxID=3572 RepID=A0AAW1GNM2_SAPOF